jgi:hypothetical protein
MDLPGYQGVVTDFEPTGLDERLDAVQRLWATYFVHSVRDGRVCRISAHATREDALADIRRRAEG